VRPFDYLRTGKGYCCEWCDGSYKNWIKKMKRFLKRGNKQEVEKDIQRQLEGHSTSGSGE